MTVIQTERNRVVIDAPEADDLYVQVTWHGPHEDGRHLRAFEGPLLPVEDYDEAVQWAVGIADQMRSPLYVVPVRAQEIIATDQMKRGVAALANQQRGELRPLVISTMAEIMRDSDEIDIRRSAFDVLVQMGVVKQ